MRLESFHFLIEKLQEAYAKSNTIYALGVDLTNIEDPYSQIISHLLKIYYSEEGEDWISWFLYEKSYNPELKLGMQTETKFAMTFLPYGST